MLLSRIDAVYEDKLDGKISEDMWQRKHGEYKKELRHMETSLEQHNKDNLDYIENGARLFELAKNVYSIYLSSSMLEKRKVLNTVLSNLVLKGQDLIVTYRLPFN